MATSVDFTSKLYSKPMDQGLPPSEAGPFGDSLSANQSSGQGYNFQHSGTFVPDGNEVLRPKPFTVNQQDANVDFSNQFDQSSNHQKNRENHAPVPDQEYDREWNSVIKGFLSAAGLTQALRGFEADIIILNPDWEREKVPEALGNLVKQLLVGHSRASFYILASELLSRVWVNLPKKGDADWMRGN
jgi:hypothetical protein